MALASVEELSDEGAAAEPKPAPKRCKPKATGKAKGKPKADSKKAAADSSGPKKRPAAASAPEPQAEGEAAEVASPEKSPAKAKGSAKAKGAMKKPARKVRASKYYYSRDKKWGIRGPDGREWCTAPWQAFLSVFTGVRCGRTASSRTRSWKTSQSDPRSTHFSKP